MFNIGTLYDNGKGVQQDYAEAKRWYEKAAAAGLSNAMFMIGFLYDTGKGVRQDYSEAKRWYEKAAAAGMIEATFAIGALYEMGHGVPQDYAEARAKRALPVGVPSLCESWVIFIGTATAARRVSPTRALGIKKPSPQAMLPRKIASRACLLNDKHIFVLIRPR